MKSACAAGLVFIIALEAVAQSAEERMITADLALTAGQPWEAKAELLKALEELRERSDIPGAAAAQILLAIAEENLGDSAAARSAVESATNDLRSHGDLFGTWLGLILLAQVEKSTGRLTAALARQGEALAIIAEARASSTPLSLEMLVRIGPALGLPAAALRPAPGHPEISKRLYLQFLCEPFTHDGYAALLIETGQFERAEEELRAAETSAGPFVEMYAFTFALRYGDLRFRQSRYDEARAQYRKALGGSLLLPLSIVPEHSIPHEIHLRLMEIELATGQGDEALRWNEEALQIARGRFGSRPLELTTLIDRANLLMRLNRFPEAEETYGEALRLAIATKNPTKHAAIEASLSGLHFMRGSYGTAAAHLEAAIELHQTLDQPATEAMLWITLAGIHILTGTEATADDALVHARKLAATSRYDVAGELVALVELWRDYRRGVKSLPELQAALDDFTRNPRYATIDAGRHLELLFRNLLSAEAGTAATTAGAGLPVTSGASLPVLSAFHDSAEGWRQRELGNLPLARQMWTRAFETAASRELRANTATAIALSFWQEGNADAAIRWIRDAAEALELTAGDLRAETMLAGFFGSERRAYYDIQAEFLIRNGQIEKAFDVTERGRARAFLRLLGNDRLQAPGGGDLLAELERLRDQIAAWDREPAPDQSLHDLRRRYEALLPRVQAVDPDSAALVRVEPLRLEDLRRQLPAGTTLVSYYVSQFGAHAWVFDAEQTSHVRLPLNDAQLRRIACWADAVGRTRSARPETVECGTDPASPQEAYAALIAPLRGRIRGSRLMVIPHGALHYVPFAALYDPATTRYLVEDFTITYLPSANALPFLRAKESPLNGGVLVLGDPETTDQPRLPGAREEALGVARKFRTTARLGKEAKTSLLHALHRKFDLVHVAAHASYDASAPLFSAIHLAGGDGKNGTLSVRDIQAEIDFSGVNLVVLSACRSGVGKRSEGDEIVGLTRAILYAGSPGVISTLWNISDTATTPLVEKFYDRLLAGASAADALRGAQIELLRDERYAAPYYWAAFVMTGDPAGKWQPHFE